MVEEISGNIKDLMGRLGLDLYDSQRFNKGSTLMILLYKYTHSRAFYNFK